MKRILSVIIMTMSCLQFTAAYAEEEPYGENATESGSLSVMAYVAGSTVDLVNSDGETIMSSVTDDSGLAVFYDMPAGEGYSIRFNILGKRYDDQIEDITVYSGETIQLNKKMALSRNGRCSDNGYDGAYTPYATKITSTEELEQYWHLYMNKPSRYNDEFFKNNYLLAVTRLNNYYDNIYYVSDFSIGDNKIDVIFDKSEKVKADQSFYYSTILELSKNYNEYEINFVNINANEFNATYYDEHITSGHTSYDSITSVPKVCTVNSYEELKKFGKIAEKYDDNFFESKFIVIANWYEPSPERVYKVLAINDSELVFGCNETSENEPTAPHAAIIEVDRKTLRPNNHCWYVRLIRPPGYVSKYTVYPEPVADKESGVVPYGTIVNVYGPDSVSYKANKRAYPMLGDVTAFKIVDDIKIEFSTWSDAVGLNEIRLSSKYEYIVDKDTIPDYDIKQVKIENSKYPWSNSIIPQNTSFNISMSIGKKEEKDENIIAIAAVYDRKGRLLYTGYAQPEFSDAADAACSIAIPAQEQEIGSIKTFLWDSLESMQAISDTMVK